MFVGHLGLGLAAKALTPRVSLAVLFLSVQLVDLLWPSLLLLGLEEVRIAPGITAVTPLDFVHYPISHSLVMGIAWGLLAGALYLWRRGDRRSAAVVALGVMSHWVLDLVTHRPDLPLWPGGGPLLGLGLWNSVPATLIVELVILGTGVTVYAATTRPVNRAGSWGLGSLVVFLVVVYLANIFGPPPPSVAAIAWTGQSMWLLVAWAWWIDRNRRPRTAPST